MEATAVPELPIGTYDVTVTQGGFQTFVAKGVTVDVATERRVDAALKAGRGFDSGGSSADQLPIVETTTNDLGGVLTSENVENLPVNGRDYTKLMYLESRRRGIARSDLGLSWIVRKFSMNGARGARTIICSMAPT